MIGLGARRLRNEVNNVRLGQLSSKVFRGLVFSRHTPVSDGGEVYEIVNQRDLSDRLWVSGELWQMRLVISSRVRDRQLLQPFDIVIGSKFSTPVAAYISNIDDRKLLAGGGSIVLRLREPEAYKAAYVVAYLRSTTGGERLFQKAKVVADLRGDREYPIRCITIEELSDIDIPFPSPQKQREFVSNYFDVEKAFKRFEEAAREL